MLVRRAMPQDMPALLLGVAAFADVAYPGERMDAEHVRNFLASIMANDAGLVAIMEAEQAQFAGIFVAILHANMLTGEPSMGELLFYVDPEARGHGRKLLAYAEDWARENDCRRATLCHLETTPRLETAYRRWGYEPLERTYVKELA